MDSCPNNKLTIIKPVKSAESTADNDTRSTHVDTQTPLTTNDNISSLTKHSDKAFMNMEAKYNPHQNLISNLECLNRLFDEHSSNFDNFIFIGDFNVSTNHNSIINFCDLNGLKNLINVSTCYKTLTIQPVLI